MHCLVTIVVDQWGVGLTSVTQTKAQNVFGERWANWHVALHRVTSPCRLHCSESWPGRISV